MKRLFVVTFVLIVLSSLAITKTMAEEFCTATIKIETLKVSKISEECTTILGEQIDFLKEVVSVLNKQDLSERIKEVSISSETTEDNVEIDDGGKVVFSTMHTVSIGSSSNGLYVAFGRGLSTTSQESAFAKAFADFVAKSQ